MSAKKIVGRSVALIVVFIVLIAALGGILEYFTTQINDIDARYNNYVATHSHTDSDYDSLSSSTHAQIASLQTQMTQLQTEISQLQTWLNGNITAHSSYVSDHTYTNEQWTILQNQYASLESNLTALMSKYESLIPPNNGITIESVGWNKGINISVTDVVVRNWGVSATTVISMKLYWNNQNLFASSASFNVTISGNSTVNISTFLPITGWNTAYDTWNVTIYTLEGYTATSDPLPLAML